MRVGIIDQMWASSEVETKDYLHETMHDVRLADELGYDSIWFGEHHFKRSSSNYGRVPVPELLIARLANETQTIRLGTGVKILPLDTPLHFAEEVSLLDLLTDGRAVFGVGQGSGPDIEFTGLDAEEKHRRYRAHFGELLAYLVGDITNGRQPLSPPPTRDLTRLLWVASRDADSITFAAERDLNFVVGQAEPAIVQAEYVARYRALGGSAETRGCRYIFVGETDADAYSRVEPAATRLYEAMKHGPYYHLTVARGLIPDTPPTTFSELLDRLEFAAGSPETVAARLQRYLSTTSVDRLDVMMHIPLILPEDLRRSMTMFAQEVVPRLDSTRVEMVS